MIGAPFIIGKEYIKQVSRIMFEAYRDYPLWRYLIPKNEDYEKSHSLWESQVLYGVNFGYVIASSHNFEGALILVHSQHANVPLFKLIQCGGLRIIRDLGFIFCRNSTNVTKLFEANRSKIFEGKNKYWYIFYAAVLPSEQHKGVGRSMMDFIITHTANSGLPYCLETAKQVNVDIYEKLGYEVQNHCFVGDSNIHSWLMVRKGQ